MQCCSKQANKILKCYAHECWTARCPVGKGTAYVSFILPAHTSLLDRSQTQRLSTMKCVIPGSCLWRFMASWDLVSSDKLQRLPNACPNLFNFIPRYSLGRWKLLWLSGQSEEAGFDSDICLRLSTRALASWPEPLTLHWRNLYQVDSPKIYLGSWHSIWESPHLISTPYRSTLTGVDISPGNVKLNLKKI